MKMCLGSCLLIGACTFALACSSDDGAGGTGGGGAGGTNASPMAGSGGVAGAMVSGGTGGASGASGGTSGAGGGGTGGISGVGGGGAGGAGGTGGTGGAGGAGGTGGTGGDEPEDAGDDAGDVGNGSDLTGMLGALGDVKPVLSGWATTNGLETLIYLSSSPLTCEQMMTEGTPWLSTLPAGTQVIEIVVRGMATVGTTNVGFLAGEINYAEGSKSSSFEVNADSGSITFTTTEAMGVYEGSLEATYPMGSLMGTFHAEWCEGGQEY